MGTQNQQLYLIDDATFAPTVASSTGALVRTRARVIPEGSTIAIHLLQYSVFNAVDARSGFRWRVVARMLPTLAPDEAGVVSGGWVPLTDSMSMEPGKIERLVLEGVQAAELSVELDTSDAATGTEDLVLIGIGVS